MIGELRMRELVVIVAVLAPGLAGSVVALGSRGADSHFIQGQKHPPNLRPGDVERLVRSAPDPRTGTGTGLAATCRRGGSGPLGHPWSCVVRYRSGNQARLVVRIRDDGSYSGRYSVGGLAEGCCVELTGASG